MNNGPVSWKHAVECSLDNQIRGKKKMKVRVNEQGPSWPLLQGNIYKALFHLFQQYGQTLVSRGIRCDESQ